MSSATTSKAARRPHPVFEPPVRFMSGIDHLELWVGNARAFCQFLVSGFGFECVAYGGPETGLPRAGYALAQGRIRLLVTAGSGPADEVTDHVARHGDGVRTIAFGSNDVEAASRSAQLRGARASESPDESGDRAGVLRRAAIEAYGDTNLAFVDRSDYAGAFAPGFSDEGLPRTHSGRKPGLSKFDHVVANVDEGDLDYWARWHRHVLGLHEMRHFDAEQISTAYSALRSTVVWDRADIVLPINEPAPGLRKSQITEYLEAYCGPGVQHVAFGTDDILRAVDELSRRGVRFLLPPAGYYDEARDRCRAFDLPWAELARLGILVDVDSGGLLLQVFSETLADRPTLFVEVIERRGATGFGEGNFKALFEAIEHEQARRGNL